MRKNKIITIVIVMTCLLATLAGGLVLRRHYLPTSGPTNALFEKYKNSADIDASLLRDFRVNDTLAVEIILLQATTDSAWYALLREFGRSEELIEWYQSDKESLTGDSKCSTICFLIDKNNPKKCVPLTDPNCYLVVGSLSMRSLCVFLTADKNVQTKKSLYYFATEHHKVKELINSTHKGK